MMPLWPTYLKGAAALMYVVDISDAYQLAASATAFHHLCDLPAMRDKRVLLIWNKTDAPCALRDAETAAFDAARAETALKDALTTIQVSALDGSNAEQVMTWIRGVYGV
jgi:50S ribosomal subunit-associated GTPase HflX